MGGERDMCVLSLEDWPLNWHPLETETSEHLWITSVHGIIPMPLGYEIQAS